MSDHLHETDHYPESAIKGALACFIIEMAVAITAGFICYEVWRAVFA